MKKYLILFSIFPLFLYCQKLDKNTFGDMRARHIGPAVMSGRIAAVDAVHSDPRIVYVGAASGGIWKSDNAGTTFQPVFDDHLQSIGALAIDQRHPDTVWAGTGECWVRNSVSVGDGIYKTTDGGEKWQHMGLKETERIAKIAIHPGDPDIVYVAAMGHLWDANEERGVYRTTDGGKTWDKILYVDENTGCSDLALDPEDPDVVYAGMWDYRRQPHYFRSGGKGSGLYISRDGGDTWKKVEENMPDGTLGRIAVAVSPADPDIAWALVEAGKTGLYRSDDKGFTWELVNNSPTVGERPFYFAYLVPDPVDTNRIYKPGFTLNVSDNGGKTFSVPFVNGGNIHPDLHAMYISPADPGFIYLGTDGGLYISHDKGNTWKMCRNLPISQFYRVTIDHSSDYHVYGGLQDNGSWHGPVNSPGGIANRDWVNVGYGDGFNVLRDIRDPNVLYWQYQGGNIRRYYSDNREYKDIKPFAEEAEEDLRFNWNTPLVQGPSGALYVGAQYLYRSTDMGDTWERISPDLTTDDPSKQQQEETGGLTLDNSSAENHTTIYSISESPLNSDVIWVGTDDGNLQLTTDGGKTWKNVAGNLPGLPPGTWCSSVKSGNFGETTAYATFDGHRHGDMKPYVYKTTDFGTSWTALASDEINLFCHTVTEDLVNPDLLFLGTEAGLYVTVDGGENWTEFGGNVPKVPVREMRIHPYMHDLVIGTHGRGVLVIDDITPLRQLRKDMPGEELVFLDSRPYVARFHGMQQRMEGDDGFTGPNAPDELMITYYLKKRHIFGDMYLEVHDPSGALIATLPAGTRKGINRVGWSMRMDPPKVPSSVQLLGSALYGPGYPPGEYTVTIVKGEDRYEGKVSIEWDPESRHTVADRELRYDALMRSYGLLEDLGYIDRVILDMRDGATERAKAMEKRRLKKELEEIAGEMDSLRKELLATRMGRITGERRLRERIGDIYGGIMGYQGKPTASQWERLESLEEEVESYMARVDRYRDRTLADINISLEKEGLPPIAVTDRATYEEED